MANFEVVLQSIRVKYVILNNMELFYYNSALTITNYSIMKYNLYYLNMFTYKISAFCLLLRSLLLKHE